MKRNAQARPSSRGRVVLRWIVRGVVGIAVVVLVAAEIIYVVSERRMQKRYEVPVHALSLPTDSAALERGARIARIRGCIECHGPGLRGNMLVNDLLLARLAPPNLTTGRGGRGAALGPEDWERAIRHGIRGDGTPLIVMPSYEFADLTDEDVGALIAYARSLPAVDNVTPALRIGPLGRALFLAGEIPMVPAERMTQQRKHVAAISADTTPAFGRYVAASCQGCHGAGFSGGKMPGSPPKAPPSANLTPDSSSGIGRWSEGDFVRALREGKRPDGSAIDRAAMPIAITAQMTDTELRATYRYLRTLPARKAGTF